MDRCVLMMMDAFVETAMNYFVIRSLHNCVIMNAGEFCAIIENSSNYIISLFIRLSKV